MLKSHAHTFRSRSRLAVGLSWVAGYTNAITLIAAGQTVSHQTGNTTHLGEQIGTALTGDGRAMTEAAYFAALIGSFGLGALASGLITGGSRRSGRRSRFVLPMTVEAILLSVVVLLTMRWPHPEHGAPLVLVTLVAAAAMGLQNATITRISGAVVRTTHLTGVVTDLGLELAGLMHARRGRLSWRHLRRLPGAQRVALLAAIFATFLTGAVLGTTAYQWHRLGTAALLGPVVFLTAIVVREQLAAVAEVRPVDPPAELAGVVPGDVGLFRLAHRGRRRDHPPDWLAWAEQLPPRWRVAVVSVDPLTTLHADSAVGLLSAAALLRATGRTLVVAGLSRSHLKLLRRHDPRRRLKWADFPPDLEFAVARAISLSPDADDGGDGKG